MQTSQVLSNITTNEVVNWHKYRYLRGSDGKLSNPFDKGWRQNLWEAFNPDKTLQAPVVLDDIEGTSEDNGVRFRGHHERNGSLLSTIFGTSRER